MFSLVTAITGLESMMNLSREKIFSFTPKKLTSLLKNQGEIKKKFSQLDTMNESQLSLKQSQNLLKECDDLKGKILLKSVF